MEAMVERHILPTVSLHDGFIQLLMDLTQPRYIFIAGITDVRIVDHVVQARHAEVPALHNLLPRLEKCSSNIAKLAIFHRSWEGDEHGGRNVRRILPHTRPVLDAPITMHGR